MSNRSGARGTAAASSIKLTLRTSNAVATSNASPSRCFLFCVGSRAARSARTAAATVSTPPIPKAPPNQRRSPPTTSPSRPQEIMMGGEAGVLHEAVEPGSDQHLVQAVVEHVARRTRHLRPRHHQVALTIPLSPHCHSRTPARSLGNTESDRADFVNGLITALIEDF